MAERVEEAGGQWDDLVVAGGYEQNLDTGGEDSTRAVQSRKSRLGTWTALAYLSRYCFDGAESLSCSVNSSRAASPSKYCTRFDVVRAARGTSDAPESRAVARSLS
jgi:hypothetical protein